MEREVVFNTDWLDERYAFDASARHPETEETVLESIKGKQTVHLVDVGSGNGANTRYFMQKIKASQHWTLVEQDLRLTKASLQNLATHGKEMGYSATLSENTLLLKSSTKTIEVTTINQSLLQLSEHIDLSTIDLVVANAVFDLFSGAQFAVFVQQLVKYKTPCYATLNYEAMQFFPSKADDSFFVGQYESHMHRPQSFGKGMGKECSNEMERLFKAANASINKGESKWMITENDPAMHLFLLGFMEEALHEVKENQSNLARLKNWLSIKNEQVASKSLRLEVNHLDLFASWEQ